MKRLHGAEQERYDWSTDGSDDDADHVMSDTKRHALKAGNMYLFCTYSESFRRFQQVYRIKMLNVLENSSWVNVQIPPSAPDVNSSITSS